MGLQEAYGQNDGGGGTALAGIVIENPTAADNFVLRYIPEAITMAQLSFVLVGATDVIRTERHEDRRTGPDHVSRKDRPIRTSATVFVSFGPDRSVLATDVINAGTVVSNTTTGQIITSFDNASIPAGSWLAVRVTALVGTPTQLHVSAAFNYD